MTPADLLTTPAGHQEAVRDKRNERSAGHGRSGTADTPVPEMKGPPRIWCSARHKAQMPIRLIDIPIRRSVSTSADSEDPSDSPKGARHRCAEEMATHLDGPTRITEWLSAWLSKSEGGYTAIFLTVQHRIDLHWLQACKELQLLMNCEAARTQRSLTKIATCP
jgi:hypothetical protein